MSDCRNIVLPVGDTGSPGIQGEPAERASDGLAATIQVGTVTTLAPNQPATVQNSGNATAAIFDFGIPKGTPGTDGDDGVGIEGKGYKAQTNPSTAYNHVAGLQTFDVQNNNLAYTNGARVRISLQTDTSKFMEGLVTNYSGTNLIVNIAFISTPALIGSATGWNVNLAGEKGLDGVGDDRKVSASPSDNSPDTLNEKVGKSIVVNTSIQKAELVGDEDAPGPNKFYGTDKDGLKKYNSIIFKSFTAFKLSDVSSDPLSVPMSASPSRQILSGIVIDKFHSKTEDGLEDSFNLLTGIFTAPSAGSYTMYAFCNFKLDPVLDTGDWGALMINHGAVTNGPFTVGGSVGNISGATGKIKTVGSGFLLINKITGTFLPGASIQQGTITASIINVSQSPDNGFFGLGIAKSSGIIWCGNYQTIVSPMSIINISTGTTRHLLFGDTAKIFVLNKSSFDYAPSNLFGDGIVFSIVKNSIG